MSSMKLWHKAFIAISKDINAQVLCPECGKVFLKIEDIPDDAGNLDKRCLYCPECGEKRYQLVKMFEEFINALKNSGDESIQVTDDGSRVSVRIDLTKSEGGHNPKP